MIEVSWSVLKDAIDDKSLKVQYSEDSDFYYIWASDTILTILCKLLKDGGADQLDFETNYKPTANTGYDAVKTNSSATTQPISASSLPLPSGAATSALQTQPGVDIGDVTINNASGGSAVNIQDGGNSITVDGSVAATQSGTWTIQPGNTANTTPWLASIHDGTTKATVRDLAANDALNVAIVDDSGNQITSFGGGTQYDEDTAHVSGDKLTMAGVVQKSADAALSSDGDRSVLQVDATGYLKVNVKAGSAGGTEYADGAVRGTATGTLAMGDDGTNIQSISVDSTGKLNVNNISGTISLPTGAATSALQTQPGVDIGDVTINNASGGSAVNIQDGGNSITVDGTVTTSPSTSSTTGSITGSGTVTLSVAGMGSIAINILGTWTGLIEFEAKIAGGTYRNISLQDMILGDGQNYSNTTANGMFTGNVAGFDTFRLSGVGVTGTANVELGAAVTETVLQGITGYLYTQSNLRDGSGTSITSTGGALDVNISSGTVTVTQGTGTNLHTVVDSGTVTTVTSLTQMNGAAISMGTGTRDSGTQRVTIATNDVVPASQSGAWSVTATQATGSNLHTVIDSGTVTTVSTVTNLSQLGGTAISMNSGTRDAGTQRVTIATNDAVPVTDNSGSLTVDNSGTFAVQATIAASASNIAKAEDVGFADADVGVPAMAVRKASPANSSGTDGDYEMLQMSAGRLWTSSTIDAALPTGSNVIGALSSNQSVNVAQINGVTTTMGNGVSGTGVQRVTLASDSTGQVTLATGSNTIGALTANQSTNISQMNGVTVTMGNGASGTGVQRVTIADDSTGLVKLATGSNTIGALTANQSINNAQVNGSTMVTSVTGVQDVMPRKRTGSTGLSPNYSGSHITTKTTTTPTSSTAYVSAIVISCSNAGTAATMVIQNKEATPKILVPSFTLTVPTTGLPIILQFAEPIVMTSGIDIITGGTTMGVADVFITYWQ